MKSRKPIAKEFKKWVMSEVLPSIRREGKYELEKTMIKQK
jgi:prophage antirepressor-like protein